MKNRLTFIFIIVLSSIILSNCTTTSQMYLQSAKSTDDDTYGYSKSNPIILQCSKSYGNNKIIDEYISRLFKSPNLSFTIIERETIAIPQSNAIQTDTEIKYRKPTKCVDSLERIKIISDTETKTLNISRKQTYTLYFKLVKHKRKIFYPTGFGYSRLCG